MTSGVGVLGSRDREILLDASTIIGVDEVGRGALAGPVVVCAAAFEEIPDDGDVRDSKLLNSRRRNSVANRLHHSARWVVCEIWPELIDRVNILEATRLAMAAAARTLIEPHSVVITDFVHPGNLGCPILSPKRADRDYFCVAAASIVAKVHRDRIMVDLGRKEPHWKWERNKGYGTVDHRRALENVGPGTLHRRSFRWSPVLP